MTTLEDCERVPDQSPDQRVELLNRLREIVPELFTDGKLDLERLKVLAGEALEASPERYGLNWPGKRNAIAMLQAPSRAMLAPDRDESVNFDDARHVFIEGENLEVLKLLYRAYFGRVKLIYIDPPYNTGSDLIYHDDFGDPLAAYLLWSGQISEKGDLLTSKVETAGRKHSKWLSMMYPRLSLARQFLKDEGVILISINDAEVSNLRRLCDEIFGEENFVAQMIWEKGRKNDAKLLSVGHEYILIYARSAAALKEAGTVWREEKPGAREIWDEYARLRAIHGEDNGAIEAHLKAWFSDLPKKHPSKKWARYSRVDSNGPWRDRDISWPGGDGPRYDVLHPETKLPCKVPERGWVYSNPDEMQRQIKLGLVEFRADETEPPFRKFHLRPFAYELIEDEVEDDEADETEAEAELATQVRSSVFYKQSQVSVKYLRELMEAKVFDNPKDHEELERLFAYVMASEPDPIVLDFFAGSASSAEAVLRRVAKGTAARFIAVQLPEAVNATEKTGKAAIANGWETISQLSRERIRRALAHDHIKGSEQGVRAFRLTTSSLRRWRGTDDKTPEAYEAQLDAFKDSLEPGWNAEDIIWEVALREGLALTSKVEAIGDAKEGFWRVTDEERGRSLTLCLADTLSLDSVRALSLSKDDLFVCRATALDDTLAANLALQCRLKVL